LKRGGIGGIDEKCRIEACRGWEEWWLRGIAVGFDRGWIGFVS
jgi:hypothetical protein